MKKLQNILMCAIALTMAIGFNSCKPKDADLQKAVQTALAAMPDAKGVTVAVEKQVATLSGDVKDDATSTAVTSAAQAIKGIKSVTNNLKVTPPAPVMSPIDEKLTAALVTALKDNPSVTAAVQDGVVTLTGEVNKAKLKKIMQKVSALKPTKIVNKLTIK